MALQRAGLTDKEIVQVRAYLDELQQEAAADGKNLTAKRLDAEYAAMAHSLRVPVEVIHGHFPRKKAS
jgi:DNA recombination-dependent growth factor C